MPLPDLQFLPSLPVALPERRALVRLGYAVGRTALPEAQRCVLRRQMEEAFRRCRPVGVHGTLGIRRIEGDAIHLADGSVVRCADLGRRLQGCGAVWLGAVTLGPGLAEHCAGCIAAKRGSEAAVADAVGSETAEKAIGFLQEYAAARLLRRGITMTDWRFSPGYGDWPLQDQQRFLGWLQMDRLGITLTANFLMLPEKSITALAGLRTPPGQDGSSPLRPLSIRPPVFHPPGSGSGRPLPYVGGWWKMALFPGGKLAKRHFRNRL